MKQSEIRELLDWLFDYTTLKESAIKSSIKKQLLECMQEFTYIHKKIDEIDNKEISKNFSLDLTQREAPIWYRNRQESILEYCRYKWYSPYFHKWSKFQAQRHARPKIIEYTHLPNQSTFFLCLGHEIGHCLSYAKVQAIMRSPVFATYTNHHRLRSDELMEEGLSRYESLDMCKHFIDKGYPILRWMDSFDEMCDYIDLCLLTHTFKSGNKDIFIPQKVFLINRERISDILGNTKTLFKKTS